MFTEDPCKVITQEQGITNSQRGFTNSAEMSMISLKL